MDINLPDLTTAENVIDAVWKWIIIVSGLENALAFEIKRHLWFFYLVLSLVHFMEQLW